jgi:hypothetical protein
MCRKKLKKKETMQLSKYRQYQHKIFFFAFAINV